MTPEEFVKAYEAALGTQDWKLVDPLVSELACVTFSDGTVHRGKQAIQIAYDKNFRTIKSEKYRIENTKWIRKEPSYAVYSFEYKWAGLIEEKLVSGEGVGTAVLVATANEWQLLTEHLGRKPVSN